jgi:hypothetical protein
MKAEPISITINNPKNDDPSCVEPLGVTRVRISEDLTTHVTARSVA